MAVQGVPLERFHSLNDITDAITVAGGNIVKACGILKINTDTFYEVLKKNPEMWDLVYKLRKESRSYNRTQRVDLALTVIEKILYSKEAKHTDKLRASMYYLDNLGEEEGFGKRESQGPVDEKEVEKYDRFINQITKLQSARNIAESNTNVAEKSELDTGENLA